MASMLDRLINTNILLKIKIDYYLICALAIIIAYLAPLFILKENAHILVYDNLDSNIALSKMLADSGKLFGSLNDSIPQIMNGIPRNVLGSEFNVIQWLFVLFDPYTVYALNLTIMHLVAFIGMYLLLKRYFFDKEEDKIILTGVSLSFALLPFWPFGGLSVSGMPLLFYAFLNIRCGKWSKTNWAIIALFPLYSSFALAGIFIIIALGILFSIDFIRFRKLNYQFISAIILMVIIYLFVEYRLVYVMFFDNAYVSHRVEFGIIEHINLIGALKSSLSMFIFGQYHAASLQQYFIGLSVAVAFLILIKIRARYDYFIILVGIAAFIALFYGLWHWDEIALIRSHLGIVNSFQFDRFYFLYPLIWYLIFGIALKIIRENLKRGSLIVLFFLALQIGFLFSVTDASCQCGGFGILLSDQPGFNEFYSPDLFAEIKNSIGDNPADYRVVSIGIFPAVSLYNGFYALDSYQANYPLKYKHEFRMIMANELKKNEAYQTYFDKWGSRCNIFASQLTDNFMNFKYLNTTINSLDIDTDILYDMGGRYVISAVQIKNAEAINLSLIDIFEKSNSPWRIWLYSVRDNLREEENQTASGQLSMPK
jgi:hypothetical protein